jgi:hypothetical protein
MRRRLRAMVTTILAVSTRDGRTSAIPHSSRFRPPPERLLRSCSDHRLNGNDGRKPVVRASWLSFGDRISRPSNRFGNAYLCFITAKSIWPDRRRNGRPLLAPAVP